MESAFETITVKKNELLLFHCQSDPAVRRLAAALKSFFRKTQSPRIPYIVLGPNFKVSKVKKASVTAAGTKKRVSRR